MDLPFKKTSISTLYLESNTHFTLLLIDSLIIREGFFSGMSYILAVQIILTYLSIFDMFVGTVKIFSVCSVLTLQCMSSHQTYSKTSF
jgi:hypothetical protein